MNVHVYIYAVDEYLPTTAPEVVEVFGTKCSVDRLLYFRKTIWKATLTKTNGNLETKLSASSYAELLNQINVYFLANTPIPMQIQ